MPQSLHAYFVRAGKPDVDVTYSVARTRDGQSFDTRQVTALETELAAREVPTRAAGVQRPHVMQLLPIEPPAPDAATGEAAAPVQYDFTPAPEELLAELLPATVKVRLFQCFIDAAVSEEVARMVAMKSATDAAGDMIRTLTQHYNRARQSQITLELLDIVSGAEAIK